MSEETKTIEIDFNAYDFGSIEHMNLVHTVVALYRDAAPPVAIYPHLEKLATFWHEKGFPCAIEHGIRDRRKTERDAEFKAWSEKWWDEHLPDKPPRKKKLKDK